MLGSDVLGSATSIIVATITTAGAVLGTYVAVSVRGTARRTKDVQQKVNGRLDQLLESNRRLTDTLLDYLTSDTKKGRRP